MDASNHSCSRRHRALCAGALAILAASVLWSGTAGALGYYGWSLWPWNRAWYMFSWSDGHLHHLDVTGQLEDESTVTIDAARWFRYPASFDSLRTGEIVPEYSDLCRLARYLARRYNAEAPPGRRVVSVSISDVAWRQEDGRRLRFEEVPSSRKRTWYLVSKLDCHADP